MTRTADAEEEQRPHGPAESENRRPGIDRRTLLTTGSTLTLAGLAGCSLQSDPGGSDDEDCADQPGDLSQPVPAEYENVTSQADIERDAAQLLDRSEASYQSEPNGDQRCERCSYYVEDRNGDCLGACVRVEGYIEPNGWCEYYRTQVGGGW